MIEMGGFSGIMLRGIAGWLMSVVYATILSINEGDNLGMSMLILLVGIVWFFHSMNELETQDGDD